MFIASLLVVSTSEPARSARDNRDIVFAAEYFRHTNKVVEGERTLARLGPSHLYRIRHDGTGRIQITSGPYDDFNPAWSPDGSRIAFLRGFPANQATLCIVDEAGKQVQKFLPWPDDVYEYGRLRWSPDGTKIAVEASLQFNVVDLKTSVLTTRDCWDGFAWSPDSRHIIYTTVQDNKSEDPFDRPMVTSVLDLSTGAVKSFPRSVKWPNWPTLQSVWTLVQSEKGVQLQTMGVDGSASVVTPVKEFSFGEDDPGYSLGEGFNWYPFPHDPQKFALEFLHGMSDGRHPSCAIFDAASHELKYVRPGQLLGISKDGRLLASCELKWEGPYKRGGERVGPILVTNLKSRRAVAITSKMGAVHGGDWR